MLLNESQVDRLETEVFKLLEDVGLGVRNDEITAMMLKAGCTQAPTGRLLIPRALAQELILSQIRSTEEEQQRAAEEDAPAPIRASADYVMRDAFAPGPTQYYDFERGETVALTEEIVEGIMRFADATPQIGGVHCWWPGGIEPEVESIVILLRALKVTRKALGLDAIYPKQVKYLIEIGEILTGESRSTRYLAGSQCMTPPLVLGERAAGEMLERYRCGVPEYFVATMTMVGISSPITNLGAVVSGAAEVLGGMVAAHAICAEASIIGGAYVVSSNIKGDQMTMAAPEMAWINAAIRELFERRFGGRIITGTEYSPCARVPGLQATYENYFLAFAAAELEGHPLRYAGRGLLANGSVGSPEQLMLDIEAQAELSYLRRPAVLDEEALAVDVMREVMAEEGRTFLDHDHTLRHWRERWTPRLFLWDAPGPGSPYGDGSERHMLERAHQMCLDNLARYEPPDWPADVLKALDDVERRARREFLG
ncbi:MAG: trimethylamine methyltransferase family protein [Planctomycetes bacterium]|nr:trimethylamine methyltransferase family protein [Planctomycetota bacterium]